MARRVHFKNNKIAVYRNDNDDVLTDPEGNIDDCYFHCDLDYLVIKKVYEGTLSLPSANSSTGYTDRIYNLGNHGAGSNPYVYCSLARALFSASHVFSNSSRRAVSCHHDNTKVWLREMPFGSAPADDIHYRVIVFGQPESQPGNKGMRVQGGKVTFGGSTFDTDKDYLKINDNTSIDMFFAKGRTMDVSGGGLRIARANGSFYDRGPYDGNWSPSGVRGVDI
jgi:hypothetical protein